MMSLEESPNLFGKKTHFTTATVCQLRLEMFQSLTIRFMFAANAHKTAFVRHMCVGFKSKH